jgi:hypothetical protein
MKINYKKGLKLTILLITSLLIATVSAGTYYTMYMHATNIGVETGSKAAFTPGSQWPTGSSMGAGNQTVTLDGMKGQNGTATTIEDPVRIRNIGASSINLKVLSWDGETQTKLNYINITLWDTVPSGGNQKGNTIYLVPGSGDVTETGAQPIGANAIWRVQWTICWKSDASTETVNVELILEVS